jgi:hypothetical protein
MYIICIYIYIHIHIYIYIGKSEQQVADIKLKELKNGRLAMLAIGGLVHQTIVTGSATFGIYINICLYEYIYIYTYACYWWPCSPNYSHRQCHIRYNIYIYVYMNIYIYIHMLAIGGLVHQTIVTGSATFGTIYIYIYINIYM